MRNPTIICPINCQSNNWWRFLKILCPFQNIWTLVKLKIKNAEKLPFLRILSKKNGHYFKKWYYICKSIYQMFIKMVNKRVVKPVKIQIMSRSMPSSFFYIFWQHLKQAHIPGVFFPRICKFSHIMGIFLTTPLIQLLCTFPFYLTERFLNKIPAISQGFLLMNILF